MTSLFVAFEGIDGSGKTTVSAVVARLLRERGITVHHLREDGKLASPLSQWIRDLGRDVRNLDMAR
jgi:dTMP kinase